MSDFITYNGDYLLKIFKDLDINLGDLNPNVVRAWFDTDDEDMINFLNFMCSALSRENIVSAQELAEFESLENPLYNTELDNAFKKLEGNNPGIFDYDLNSRQLKVSLAELEQLEREERRLDELLKMDEHLQQSLSKKKLRMERESVEIDFNYEEASKKCDLLCQELDEKNKCLHEKISRELIALANFQCGESCDFFNRKNLNEILDSDEFHRTLEDMVKKQQNELSGYFTQSNINLNSTPNDENYEDKLESFQSKIFSSYMDYLKTKMEAESLVEVFNFLENFFTQDYLLNCSTCSLADIAEQKEMLLSKLEKKASVVAEEPIISIKIKKSEQELMNIEDNVQCFHQISKYYSKLLCTTSCALMLLLQEKKSIEETDHAIRYVSKYISHDLEDTKDRLGIMLNTINNFNNISQSPLEHRDEVLNSIVAIYGENTMKGAFLSCNQLDKTLKTLEHNHFVNKNIVEILEELYKNDVAKQFLTSGPTKKVSIIPKPVSKSLKNIKSNSDKQNSALKFLLHISSSTLKKLSTDKWLKNFRLIWVYFLVSPKKMKELYCQMEEELKTKEVKAVKFKE